MVFPAAEAERPVAPAARLRCVFTARASPRNISQLKREIAGAADRQRNKTSHREEREREREEKRQRVRLGGSCFLQQRCCQPLMLSNSEHQRSAGERAHLADRGGLREDLRDNIDSILECLLCSPSFI